MSSFALTSRKELPVASMNDLVGIGSFICQSGLLGQITPALGFLVATTCYQENLSIIDFVRRYDIVQGKISKKAKAMLAEFKCMGGKVKFNSYSDTVVDITFTRRNDTFRLALTIEDAIKQEVALTSKGELKDTWRKFPRRMLFSRVVSEGIGIISPGITTGIYTPEEVSDFTQEEIALASEEEYSPMTDETPPNHSHSFNNHQSDVEVCLLEGDYYGKRWESLSTDILRIALTAPQLSEEQKQHINDIILVRERETNNDINDHASV